MKTKYFVLIRLLLILGVLLGMSGGLKNSVPAAAPCTWNGSTTDWYSTDNWTDCEDTGGDPTYPGTDHDVTIPAGQSTYPVLTMYQDGIFIKTLTIEANAQITIDEQTTINANQFDNHGLVKIEDVTGHNLRIKAPFNNYGTAEFGTEPTLILYQSGTHSGSFTGRQLSFYRSTIERINTFETTSSIDVDVLMIDDNNTIDIYGSVSSGTTYIDPGSVVTISTSQTVDLGTIILRGGELIIDAFNVSAGETFSGTGTIQTNLTNSGTVSPGESPGTITVDGNYTQDAIGVLEMEIGGTTAGTGYDQLIVTGSAALDGTLQVSLIDGYSPDLGDSFTLMTYTSHTGAFATETLPALGSGLKWEVNYGYTALTLKVVKSGGTIQGTATYTGSLGISGPISVSAHLSVDADREGTAPDIQSGDTYSIEGLQPGSYYVRAYLDANNSGGPPDDGELLAWYDEDMDGVPDPVVISTGTPTQTGIDIVLKDDLLKVYLPIILR